MVKSEDNMKLKQIYELSVEFFNYEEFIKHKPKNEIQGYLIDKADIDIIKGLIDYNLIMPDIRIKKIYELIKNKIKRNTKYKEFKNNYVPKYFQNSKELIEELDNQKNFVLINTNLCVKISNEKMFLDKAIKFKFTEDDIVLIFNENDKISFPIKDCLNENLISIKNIKRENKFKEDLEILIQIYYFHKKLKNKNNSTFKELKEEDKITVYLINNSWLEKYKSYFEFNTLKNYLNENTKFSSYLIQKIILNLPNEYIK